MIGLIRSFLTGSYEVKRMGPGHYKDGHYQKGREEMLIVKGSLQPLNAKEIKMAEEGDRLKALFKFYTDQPIMIGNYKTLAGADRVKINGESYKAISVEHWQGTTFPYVKTILSREPEQL